MFNEFVHLDETSVFEDYEEITDGTVQGWTLADPGASQWAAMKRCAQHNCRPALPAVTSQAHAQWVCGLLIAGVTVSLHVAPSCWVS